MNEKKIALITGCSSSLGEQITHYLLDEGYIVIGASLKGANISHGYFVDVICDLRDESSVEDLFEVVRENSSSLDLIINNESICQMDPIIETSTKSFLNLLRTNVLGVFHILKHCRPFLIRDRSHIVSISSIASQKGIENMGAFCSSMFAFEGLISSCKEEWKDLGVKFTNLLPDQIEENTETQLEFKKDNNDDFIKVLDMILKSPASIQLPNIRFSQKEECAF